MHPDAKGRKLCAMNEPLTPEPAGNEPNPGLWSSWSTGRITALIALLVAGNFLAQIVVYASGGGLFLPVLVGALAGVIVPVVWMARRNGMSLSRDFGLDHPDWVTLLGAGLLAVASLSPSSLLAELSLRIRPADPQWIALYQNALPKTVTETIVAVFAVVAVAPLAEELVFRGLLHRLLHRIWGGPAAAVLSALIFAIVHAEPWFLLGLLGVGLTLAVVWETTRSVTACWVAHAVHNAVSLGLMFTSGDIISEEAELSAIDWAWAAVSVVAFVGLAFSLRRRLTR